MRMDRDLFAEHVRGIDDRLGLVVEHLLAEPGTDAAVDAAGRGEFDHVGAAPDLKPDGAAAIVGTVAGVARSLEIGAQFVPIAERSVHMPRATRNRITRIDDARPLNLPRKDRVAQRQRRPVAIAQIAHRGEARAQGLHAVYLGIEGLCCRAERHFLELARQTASIAGQVDVAVDQAGQDIFVLEIDQHRAGIGRPEAVENRNHLAIFDDDRRRAATGAECSAPASASGRSIVDFISLSPVARWQPA
jgi:hypothetical protein